MLAPPHPEPPLDASKAITGNSWMWGLDVGGCRHGGNQISGTVVGVWKIGTYPRSEAQAKLAGESVVIWRVAVRRCMVSIVARPVHTMFHSGLRAQHQFCPVQI